MDVDLIAICREVDVKTGEIAVYQAGRIVSDKDIFVLSLRARMNPELTYFAARAKYWKENECIVERLLKRKDWERRIEKGAGLVRIV